MAWMRGFPDRAMAGGELRKITGDIGTMTHFSRAAAVFAATMVLAASATAGRFEATVTNFGAPAVAGGVCPAFTLTITPGAPTNAVGTSNIGGFAPTLVECLPSAPPPLVAWTADSTWLFEFADGTLFGNFTGGPNVGVPGFFADYTIGGGTGRFVGASGELRATGTVSFAPGRPPIATQTITGAIETPEPVAAGALGLGVLAVAGLRRRRTGSTLLNGGL